MSSDGVWRQHIVERLESIFRAPRTNGLYGVKHALEVEESVLNQLRDREDGYSLAPTDLVVLRSAALLHDVGFANRVDSWAVDAHEHLHSSAELANKVLRDVPSLEGGEMIPRVLALIEAHDESTYVYPSHDRPGSIRHIGQRGTHSREAFLSSCLQEADALVHVSRANIEEAINEWLASGLRLTPASNSGGVIWAWGHSVVGNARLTAKRAVIDAVSSSAKQRSIAAYDRIEDDLERLCTANGAVYEPELCPPKMRESSFSRLSGDQARRIQITSCWGWQESTEILRAVPIQEDASIRPYRAAEIVSKIMRRDDVSPLSLYTLNERVQWAAELHDLLMVGFGISLFDLMGLMEFRLDGNPETRIAPPIVETYDEDEALTPIRINGLVDGLHRLSAAQLIGLNAVRCTVLENVTVPLVPLPATWDEVKPHSNESPPLSDQKRRYRYLRREEFPDGKHGITAPVTDENFQYFFYRDLSGLGSAGIRRFPGEKHD